MAETTETLKYAEIKRAVRQRVLREYPAGSRIPSTAELRKLFGASHGTVDRAVRALVDEELLERFVGKGTYVSSAARKTKSDRIGFLWPAMPEWVPQETRRSIRTMRGYPYTAAIMHGAEEEAERSGRHIVVGASRNAAAPRFAAEDGQVDAVLILFNSDQGVITAYHEQGLPVVVLDPFTRPCGVPFVANDNYNAGHQAASHAIALGHRRIMHVTVELPTRMLQWRERQFGFLEALREADLEAEGAICTSPAKQDRPQYVKDGIHGSSTWLVPDSPKPFLDMVERFQPTACFCVDDDVAAWTIATCHTHGIGVPEDMSVIGVNDTGVAEHLWPPLTTVHLGLEEMGAAAVRIANRLIEEKRLTGNGELVPVRLIERSSVKQLTDSEEVHSGVTKGEGPRSLRFKRKTHADLPTMKERREAEAEQ